LRLLRRHETDPSRFGPSNDRKNRRPETGNKNSHANIPTDKGAGRIARTRLSCTEFARTIMRALPDRTDRAETRIPSGAPALHSVRFPFRASGRPLLETPGRHK